ncbi:MAG: hypothetical protein K0R92_3182 [Lachnospiraceae bacterium]|jgi:hypothetical protein|nr:hypothetical protein [Lachnospiraceae bacterium]
MYSKALQTLRLQGFFSLYKNDEVIVKNKKQNGRAQIDNKQPGSHQDSDRPDAHLYLPKIWKNISVPIRIRCLHLNILNEMFVHAAELRTF